MSASLHVSVMRNEAIAALAPADGETYADATLGGGGDARAALDAADCVVFGFDRDPDAITRARGAGWSSAYGKRLILVNRPFAEMEDGLAEHGIDGIDGAMFDLGVSSMHLDEAERGFSFRHDGPLSMRMDCGEPTAADVVNTAEASDLAGIFRAYGEERKAGRIARAIVEERGREPIRTTARLAEVIARAAPAHPQDKIHPATRVFQALRIFVNDELGQLVRGLVAAERLLKPAGRLVVVTFHSLEDRIVKRFLQDRAALSAGPSRHAPRTEEAAPTFRLLFSKPKSPGEEEVRDNPRARSAKLRAAIRLDVPARMGGEEAFAPKPLSLSKSLNKWR